MSVVLVGKIQRGKIDLGVGCRQFLGNLWSLCTCGEEEKSCVMARGRGEPRKCRALCWCATHPRPQRDVLVRVPY